MRISPRRVAACATSRLATFAHASSKSRPTAPNSTHTASLIRGDTIHSLNGIASALHPAFEAGCDSDSRRAIARISPRTCARVAPGASRPITASSLSPRSRCGSARERNPRVGGAGEIESGRHHTGDEERLTVERHVASDDLRVRLKAASPQRIAENHATLGAPGPILIRAEHPPENRPHAEHVDGGGCDRHGEDALRLAPARQHLRGAELAVRRDARQRPRLRAQIEVVGVRERKAIAVSRELPDAHEFVGIVKRQRSQQHGIHDAEHSGRAADAEAQREDGNRGEGRMPAQVAQRVAQILNHVMGVKGATALPPLEPSVKACGA